MSATRRYVSSQHLGAAADLLNSCPHHKAVSFAKAWNHIKLDLLGLGLPRGAASLAGNWWRAGGRKTSCANGGALAQPGWVDEYNKPRGEAACHAPCFNRTPAAPPQPSLCRPPIAAHSSTYSIRDRAHRSPRASQPAQQLNRLTGRHEPRCFTQGGREQESRALDLGNLFAKFSTSSLTSNQQQQP